MNDIETGDFTGLGKIFEEYYQTMLFRAYQITQVRADAEDVVSNLMLRFMKGSIKLRSYVKSPRSYLSIMARNEALNFMKRLKKTESLEDYENKLSDDDSIDHYVNQLMFFDVIDELDQTDQYIMIAHVADHARFAKIADEINIPRSTVATRYY